MPAEGDGVVRREVCRTLGTGLLAATSGCLYFSDDRNPRMTERRTSLQCDAETYPGVAVTVAVETVDGVDGGWRIDCQTTVDVQYGNEDVVLADPRLIATDADGAILGARALDDLRWEDVPADARYSISTCEGDYPGGTLERHSTVTARALPAWIALQFRHWGFGELSVSASTYDGDDAGDPSAEDYVTRAADQGPFRTVLPETPYPSPTGTRTPRSTDG